MNAKQINAMALLNNIKGLIADLSGKRTMKAVVKEWNICIEQSGDDFLTFDFPVEGWTRKAQLIAEFERVAVQLTNIMEGREALQNAAQRDEVMVQDIQAGMNVINPVSGAVNVVTHVSDFSCYFVISFSGDMHQQYFDRGETLIVCEAEQATQTINDSIPNEALNMTTNNTPRATIATNAAPEQAAYISAVLSALITFVMDNRPDLTELTDEQLAAVGVTFETVTGLHGDAIAAAGDLAMAFTGESVEYCREQIQEIVNIALPIIEERVSQATPDVMPVTFGELNVGASFFLPEGVAGAFPNEAFTKQEADANGINAISVERPQGLRIRDDYTVNLHVSA